MADPLARYRRRDQVITRSVLDRLLDVEPDVAQDRPLSVVEQIRNVREAIRRDLEALLNTRRCPVAPPGSLDELSNALVSFGIEGIVSANLVTDQSKVELSREIERRIALFETRLSNVRVSILKTQGAGARALRMRIQATFRLHEEIPPIYFESVLDPSSQRFRVESAYE